MKEISDKSVSNKNSFKNQDKKSLKMQIKNSLKQSGKDTLKDEIVKKCILLFLK